MDPITALLLMHVATRGTRAKKSKAPAWPTPASPPPLPVFSPKATPTPAAKAADTATPLAELHANPPTPPPAEAPAKPSKRARVPRVAPGVLTSTLPVARLQQALNARGAKLVPDGLYGPKTAAAWAKAAASKALPTTITRAGPKLANVSTTAFDVLSMLPIP